MLLKLYIVLGGKRSETRIKGTVGRIWGKGAPSQDKTRGGILETYEVVGWHRRS